MAKKGGRIPPWLCYTLAGLFAAGALSLMLWGMLNPPVP